MSLPRTQKAMIDTLRKGVPAAELPMLGDRLGWSKTKLYHYLDFPRATIERKLMQGDVLAKEHAERLLATEQLVGLVERIVSESGNPEGFDAAQWLGKWLEEPHPALDGERPGDYLDTHAGIGLVHDLLLRAQTGAYS